MLNLSREQEDAMETRITRRGAAALLLSGLAFPVAKAVAASKVVVRIRPNVDSTLVALTDCNGVTFTATLSTDLRVESGGGARGFLRLAMGGRTIDYVAELGGLDFNDLGEPIRAWILMRRRRSQGSVAQDYLLGSIVPDTADCLIYDFVGPNVRDTAVALEVPGRFEILA
jgi:hypothetical protein